MNTFLKNINSKKKEKKLTAKATQSLSVTDLANDPFFIKKTETSKKVLDKYGFPKKLLS